MKRSAINHPPKLTPRIQDLVFEEEDVEEVEYPMVDRTGRRMLELLKY
jgi:hypothetical protein